MSHFPMQSVNTFLSLYLTWSCCSIQQCWVLFFLRYYLPWSRWLLFPVAPLPFGSIHLFTDSSASTALLDVNISSDTCPILPSMASITILYLSFPYLYISSKSCSWAQTHKPAVYRILHFTEPLALHPWSEPKDIISSKTCCSSCLLQSY